MAFKEEDMIDIFLSNLIFICFLSLGFLSSYGWSEKCFNKDFDFKIFWIDLIN